MSRIPSIEELSELVIQKQTTQKGKDKEEVLPNTVLTQDKEFEVDRSEEHTSELQSLL